MNKKYLDQSTSRCGIRIMSKPFSEHNNSHMDIQKRNEQKRNDKRHYAYRRKVIIKFLC